MRIAAGVLMIIGGIGASLWVTLAHELTAELIPIYPELAFVWWLLSVLSYAPMMIAFIGSYFTFKSRRWKLSLAGAICSAIGYPFIPGILAIVFLANRKGEFSSHETSTEGNERAECLSYYEEEKKLRLLLERVGRLFDKGLGKYEDEYFKARKRRVEFWSSMEKIFEVNEYFSQAASEIVRRKQEMKVAPSPASSMSAAWEAVYSDYKALKDPSNIAAGYDAMEVQGRKARQKELVKKLNESWQKALDEEKEFRKRLKLSRAEYQRIRENATRAVAADEWLRKLETECP